MARTCGPGSFGADAPPVFYDFERKQYIAIATGGNQLQGSSYGDAIWTFSLKGQLEPLWAPPPPANVAGPVGPIAPGLNTIKIGDNNVECAYWPSRTRIKAGTTATFAKCRRPTPRCHVAQAERMEHRRFGERRSEEYHLQQARDPPLHL